MADTRSFSPTPSNSVPVPRRIYRVSFMALTCSLGSFSRYHLSMTDRLPQPASLAANSASLSPVPACRPACRRLEPCMMRHQAGQGQGPHALRAGTHSVHGERAGGMRRPGFSPDNPGSGDLSNAGSLVCDTLCSGWGAAGLDQQDQSQPSIEGRHRMPTDEDFQVRTHKITRAGEVRHEHLGFSR